MGDVENQRHGLHPNPRATRVRRGLCSYLGCILILIGILLAGGVGYYFFDRYYAVSPVTDSPHSANKNAREEISGKASVVRPQTSSAPNERKMCSQTVPSRPRTKRKPPPRAKKPNLLTERLRVATAAANTSKKLAKSKKKPAKYIQVILPSDIGELLGNVVTFKSWTSQYGFDMWKGEIAKSTTGRRVGRLILYTRFKFDDCNYNTKLKWSPWAYPDDPAERMWLAKSSKTNLTCGARWVPKETVKITRKVPDPADHEKVVEREFQWMDSFLDGIGGFPEQGKVLSTQWNLYPPDKDLFVSLVTRKGKNLPYTTNIYSLVYDYHEYAKVDPDLKLCIPTRYCDVDLGNKEFVVGTHKWREWREIKSKPSG